MSRGFINNYFVIDTKNPANKIFISSIKVKKNGEKINKGSKKLNPYSFLWAHQDLNLEPPDYDSGENIIIAINMLSLLMVKF